RPLSAHWAPASGEFLHHLGRLAGRLGCMIGRCTEALVRRRSGIAPPWKIGDAVAGPIRAVGRIGQALWGPAQNSTATRTTTNKPRRSRDRGVIAVQAGAPPGTRTPNPRIKSLSGARLPGFIGVRTAAQTECAYFHELGCIGVNCNPNCNPGSS